VPKRASSKPFRVGSEQPRVFTPPLRVLTPATSKGFAAIEFAEEILELTLLPWQKWLLIHALELNRDGTYRFRTVVLLVARQNGKSTLMLVLALWRMFADGAPLVIGTAQNLDIAEELWTAAYELAEGVPELAELIEAVDKTNGKKALRLVTGERYKVAAASRRGGRGLSGDLVLLDELREHQSWDAWAAVTKTTMARARAQIWAASNAGDAASIVLRHLRLIAHVALGDPDGVNRDPVTGESVLGVDEDSEAELEDESLGIFEWSAAPGRSVWDRDGWVEANPSLGYTITEKAIASAARTDPEWVFRTEVLCQWYDGAQSGPFPAGAWEAGRDEGSSVAAGEPVAVGVDMSWDRSIVHVAVAGRRADGAVHVEVVASRAGTEWVVPWLTDPKRPRAFKAVAWQANGAPVSSLTEELEAADVHAVRWQGSDLARGTGQFYDLVRAGDPAGDGVPGVFHRSQPILDVPAATAAVKPGGDAWLWDRSKSTADISPLVAVTAAVWALLKDDDDKPLVSAYEDHGLVVA
jgi:hypothetical protein